MKMQAKKRKYRGRYRAMAEDRATKADIENIIVLLDNFAAGDVGRLKVQVSQEQAAGTTERHYHHGRCDIGSPWASGECFDAAEADCDRY